MITRAPHAGAVVQTFVNGVPNSWSGRWKKGDPLHMWTVNGKWKFLSDQERDEWMMDVMKSATHRLEKIKHHAHLFPIKDNWKTVIETQQHLLKSRFWPSEDLPGFNSWNSYSNEAIVEMEDAPDLSKVKFTASSFLETKR